MANVSVTHTFTNSTTADATQVNTNFTDIINGTSDGSKDFSISALTLAGNFTANGTTNTLGSASNDDLVINASLASSIPIKTTFTYDIGTNAIGLRDIYLADAGSAARATKIRGATIASAYTLTLPTGAGTAGYDVKNLGSGSLAFLPPQSDTLENVAIAASVGSSILTVALKGADGNDPSATNPVYVGFRSSTAATGTPVLRSITGALSVQLSSGSTIGHASAVAHWIYVYLVDNAGTPELGLSSVAYDNGSVLTTVAEGGAGAADARSLYTTTARTSVAIRLIGRMLSTQATAGTWASTMTEISLAPFCRQPIIARYEVSASTANASVAAGATEIIDLDTKLYDTHNAVTVGAAWKFTAPSTGYYRVSSTIALQSVADALSITLSCYKGGTLEAVLGKCFNSASALAIASGSAIVYLLVTEYIDIRLSNGDSSTRNVETATKFTNVCIEKINDA